jgi:hypothetical protein
MTRAVPLLLELDHPTQHRSCELEDAVGHALDLGVPGERMSKRLAQAAGAILWCKT